MFCNENGQLRWQYIFEYLTHATQVIFRIACGNQQCLIILEFKKVDKCRIPMIHFQIIRVSKSYFHKVVMH